MAQTIVHTSAPANKKIDARKDLVKAHLGLVRYIASKFGFIHSSNERFLEENDLIQFGLVGLLDAIQKFDYRKGVRFETYAVTRIRGSILDELRKLDWIPRSVRKKARRAEEIAQETQKNENRTLTAAEIAAKYSMTLDEYKELMMEARSATVDYRVNYSEDIDIIANLPADESSDPFETLSAEEVRMRMIEAVESLPQRERLIITLYYYESLTFREIGTILRVSESRVFQIHSSILGHLRRQLADLVQ
jgi:RNA polymerase sigma factor for flagellar operon FliA